MAKEKESILQEVGLEPVPSKERVFGLMSMMAFWFMAAVITSMITAPAATALHSVSPRSSENGSPTERCPHDGPATAVL